MVNLGTTTLPLAGWIADPRRPEESRNVRLAAIRRLVQGYRLQSIELTLDLASVYPHVFQPSFYSSVASLQQELGFLCTVHLPFLWVDPTSLNESIWQASLASLHQAVERTSAIDVYAYVLHLWGFTTMQIAAHLLDFTQRQLIFDALLAQADRSLGEILERVEPRRLCIENLEDQLFELAVPLIEKHDTSICLDVGHLAVQGGSTLDFLGRHADRIREIHLHDATPGSPTGSQPTRDHLALGTGQVEVTVLLHQLEQIGFQGPVILELNSQADLEESLRRL